MRERVVHLSLRRRWWLTAAFVVAPHFPRLAVAMLVFFGRCLSVNEAIGRGIIMEARPA